MLKVEKARKRLSGSTKFTFITAIISVSWLAIDYLAAKSIYDNNITEFSFQWIIISLSLIPFIIFHAAVFNQLYLSWSVSRKFGKAAEEIESKGTSVEQPGETNGKE